MAETKELSPKEGKAAISNALDGPPNGDSIPVLAEDLPEKDEVQKATKAAMLAQSPGEEAQEKAKVVKASPDAEDTPSGAALVKTAGVSDNIKRGEEYLKEKTAKRWGYAYLDAKK